MIEIDWQYVETLTLELLGQQIQVGLFEDYIDYKLVVQALYAEMMGWA